jgi:hypothetical protein
LKGRKTGPGITNLHSVKWPHWCRWLSIENRYIVPLTKFFEHDMLLIGHAGSNKAAEVGLGSRLWQIQSILLTEPHK